jgi:hypothetical protein
MIRLRKKAYRFSFLIGICITVAVLLAACAGGGASTAGTTSAGSSSINAPGQSAHSALTSSTSSPNQPNKSSADFGPLYLIKSLQVDMAVKDTQKVAADLQAWISTTDPRSSSVAIDYSQASDNLYNVSMKFSVQATLYPQIEQYLASYASQHNGKLLNLHQDTQDVTNDYIDTQSRLKNLRTAQTRLLTLLSHTNTVGDIITVQTQLTDVEGQIEQIEEHLNALQGQVTFYTITINLQPISSVAPTPGGTWNPLKTLQDALAAGLAFGAALVTLFIWLAVFSVYIIPVALLSWYIWHRTHPRQVAPRIAPTMDGPA